MDGEGECEGRGRGCGRIIEAHGDGDLKALDSQYVAR